MDQASQNCSSLQFRQNTTKSKINFPAVVFNKTPNRERKQILPSAPRAQTPVISSKRNYQESLSPQDQIRRSKAFDIESLEGSRCTNK
jgi:hypothetical protein